MTITLTFVRIEGDYGILANEGGEEITVALALLPPDSFIGCRLEYDFSEFKIID